MTDFPATGPLHWCSSRDPSLNLHPFVGYGGFCREKGIDPKRDVKFITMEKPTHHFKKLYIVWKFFQASWPCKSKVNQLGFSGSCNHRLVAFYEATSVHSKSKTSPFFSEELEQFMKNLQPRELREAVGCGATLRFGSCQGGKNSMVDLSGINSLKTNGRSLTNCGGFKVFLFSPLQKGKDSHFDECIFQMG